MAAPCNANERIRYLQGIAAAKFTTEDIDMKDRLFLNIQELVMAHSPSGSEDEIDKLLIDKMTALRRSPEIDPAGNILVRINGRSKGVIAVTAHKDEIGGIVTAIEDDGRVRVRKLGGSFPWVYGEGVVDLLGDSECVSGILSFGSRHVSHASPQFAHKESAPLRWADAWIETKRDRTQLEELGIRPGTRMVIGKHRKNPVRMGEFIGSYALDNKASLAILLELAASITDPEYDIVLAATAKEEVGAVGALYYTQHNRVDALIALEIAPLAPEYTVKCSEDPVLLAEDSHGLYDQGLNCTIREAAQDVNISLQPAVLNGFGSDGSIAMRSGHVAKAACLAFPTQNTHGFEIARLSAIGNCVKVLEALFKKSFLRG